MQNTGSKAVASITIRRQTIVTGRPDVNRMASTGQQPEIPPTSPPEEPAPNEPPGMPPGQPEEIPGEPAPPELPPGAPIEVPPGAPPEVRDAVAG